MPSEKNIPCASEMAEISLTEEKFSGQPSSPRCKILIKLGEGHGAGA